MAIMKRHRRGRFPWIMLLLAVLLMVPAGGAGALRAQEAGAAASEEPGPANTLGTRSDAEIWNTLRLGASGTPNPPTAGPEAGAMINSEGWEWSKLRNPESSPVIRYGAWGLSGVLGLLVLFFLIRGRIGYGEDTGRRILRFHLGQRVVHWSVAFVFVLMGLTGLTILFGRPFILPLIGKEAHSVLLTASMQAHNLFGPVFAVFLLALFVKFLRGNFPALVDIKWLLKGGGFFGGHAPAGRYNLGEKAWFWTAVLAGGALSVTGFIMLFPDYLATRDTIHLSELIHAIAALVMIGFSLGHIYLGTIGTRGTLQGMVDGHVDEAWARAHHDQWLAEELGRAGDATAADGAAAEPGANAEVQKA